MTLETYEIRQFGVRLKEAIPQFASDELLEELEAATQPLLSPEIDQQKPLTSFLQSLAHFAQLPTLEKMREQRIARVQTALRQHLQFWLETGELLAYANQVSPSPSRNYRKVPTDFWINAQIDWEKETTNDAARMYQRILIIDPEDFPGRELFPGMGPKYFGQEIRKAMAELETELPNFRTSEMSHKVRANHVRERVKKKDATINVKGRGFDVDTIRRHYKRHCISKSA